MGRNWKRGGKWGAEVGELRNNEEMCGYGKAEDGELGKNRVRI